MSAVLMWAPESHVGWQAAYIGLGSNLADPIAQVQRALSEIGEIPDLRVERCSSLYETAPVGITAQPSFVNAVVLVQTRLTPRTLLAHLLDIEARHARVRAERNGPRTLDLDILLFGEDMIAEPGLVVPHPRVHERAFTLLPLLEINEALVIPGIGKASEKLNGVAGQGIRRLEAAPAIGLRAS
ncbi:MAG: 2-amino-4-hydroxy-6-hydroxymethyldihydropteridine diphosphokinase [Nitrosomonadaceae bacterium]|nr:2-amino-4-hydroxy-6-hydroxymethyldihydropteridine diphosphokinase [Nitrosomonadaceae bacterium]